MQRQIFSYYRTTVAEFEEANKQIEEWADKLKL